MGMTAQLLAYTGAQFMKELGNIVVMIVSIAAALMTLYAVYIGFLFATASDANKRKAAKDRLIKTVASALIVIALSAVLGVINVNFNTVDGGHTGTGTPGKIINTTSTYASPVGTTLSYKSESGHGIVTGEVRLDSKNIKRDNVNLDKSGNNIIFQECYVAEPKGWPKGTFNAGQVGSGIWNFSIESDKPTVYVPCKKNDDGNYIIVLTVTYHNKSDQTNGSFAVDVILQRSQYTQSSNINFVL